MDAQSESKAEGGRDTRGENQFIIIKGTERRERGRTSYWEAETRTGPTLTRRGEVALNIHLLSAFQEEGWVD